jgi:hypothetical protein
MSPGAQGLLGGSLVHWGQAGEGRVEGSCSYHTLVGDVDFDKEAFGAAWQRLAEVKLPEEVTRGDPSWRQPGARSKYEPSPDLAEFAAEHSDADKAAINLETARYLKGAQRLRSWAAGLPGRCRAAGLLLGC